MILFLLFLILVGWRLISWLLIGGGGVELGLLNIDLFSSREGNLNFGCLGFKCSFLIIRLFF